MSQRINLGRVMPINKRAYSSSVSYAVMDIVEYEGSSYWCIQACQGVLPTNTTNWQLMSQKGADGSNGTNGVDGEDAYQPFKGWYDSSSSLSSSISSPVVGDYAYVMGATASDPVTVYMCSTAGTWTASQNEFNPANNQSFQTGQDLDQTKIINDLTTGGANHVLSAEAGKTLNEALGQLGPKIAKALPRDIAEDGLWICDASGKALLRLDTLDTKGGVGTNLAATIKDLIESAAADGLTTIEASAIGESLTSLIQDLIEEYAPTPSGGGNVMEVEEDGFYICNGNGEVIASWIDGEWDFGQGGGGGDEGCPKYVSALAGMDGGRITKDMAANEVLEMTNYPIGEKKGTQLSFGGKITSTFSSVRLGRHTSYNTTYVEVTSTNITIRQQSSSTSWRIATAEHGLTISTLLNINFQFLNNGQVKAYMQTLGGSFHFAPTEYDFYRNGEYWTRGSTGFYNDYGRPFAETVGTAMTGCELSVHNPDFKCPIWMFGDSYFSIGENRWTGVVKDLGYFNFYINGIGGRNSGDALDDVVRALNWGTPKYLLFSLITNDYNNSSGFINNLNSLLAICESKGITPIFATQGGLPDKNYKPHCDFIVSTGKRYIDFAHAVATNGWESGSSWYTGLLHTDGLHPTNNGANVLAMQALKDMPELMQCVGGYE